MVGDVSGVSLWTFQWSFAYKGARMYVRKLSIHEYDAALIQLFDAKFNVHKILWFLYAYEYTKILSRYALKQFEVSHSHFILCLIQILLSELNSSW